MLKGRNWSTQWIHQHIISESSNYVHEFASGNESLAELKAKIYEVEGGEDVVLYVGVKPFDYEMSVSNIAEFHVI